MRVSHQGQSNERMPLVKAKSEGFFARMGKQAADNAGKQTANRTQS